MRVDLAHAAEAAASRRHSFSQVVRDRDGNLLRVTRARIKNSGLERSRDISPEFIDATLNSKTTFPPSTPGINPVAWLRSVKASARQRAHRWLTITNAAPRLAFSFAPERCGQGALWSGKLTLHKAKFWKRISSR